MCVCVCARAWIGIVDVPLHVQEDTIYHLKQEIASLTEERDFIIFENKRLRSENEQLRIQLSAVPIKEDGTVGVTHLYSVIYLLLLYEQLKRSHLLLLQSRQRSRKKLSQLPKLSQLHLNPLVCYLIYHFNSRPG